MTELLTPHSHALDISICLSIYWLFIIQAIQKYIFILKDSSNTRLFKLKHERVHISCKSHILFSLPYSPKTMLTMDMCLLFFLVLLHKLKIIHFE